MKKFVSATLAAALAASLSISAIAAVDVDGGKIKKDDVTAGVNFISKGGYSATYEDFFEIEASTNTLIPGKTYHFPAKWSGDAMTAEFFDIYSTTVSIGSGDESRFSNSQAKKYVKDASFVKLNDGKYYFQFTASTSYSYIKDDDTYVPLKIVVVAKDKEDADYRDWEEFELEVGYGGSDTIFSGTDEYDVDNDTPIITFDVDVESCRLNFSDGSYYTATFALKKDAKVNLLHTTDANTAISSANAGANLKFLTFPVAPSFGKSSVFRFKADGKSYLYEIDSNNKLKLISDKVNNGYLSFSTNKLGSYVASDRKLSGASASTGTTTPAPTATPAPTTAPTAPTGGGTTTVPTAPAGGHFNPGTGAAV